jgi:hypothetical protein
MSTRRSRQLEGRRPRLAPLGDPSKPSARLEPPPGCRSSRAARAQAIPRRRRDLPLPEGAKAPARLRLLDPQGPGDPREADRRFAELLAEAGLPRFAFTFHDSAVDQLKLTWAHGLTTRVDLTRDLSPIDDWERVAILGQATGCDDPEPIHIAKGGSAEDPRTADSIPASSSTEDHPRHPDDLTTLDGVPVTSPSRTLIDAPSS